MKQNAFEQTHQAAWDALAQVLDALDRRKRIAQEPRIAELPELYRRVCHHLALAKSRNYSPQLIQHLHALVLRAHQHLYGQRRPWLRQAARFFVFTFPDTVRRDWRVLLVSLALFLGPGLTLGALCYARDDIVYSVMDPSEIRALESMYRPGNAALGRERDSDSDIMMFGYYIWHNIGIGFRAFAGGILLGLGTVMTLWFNGVFIGAVAGHLTRAGFGETFWSFVAGHSALELTAIVIMGMAGLKLGAALLAPGRHTRAQALVLAARAGLPLVTGAALMLFCAAFVEAFWSSSRSLPVEIKYALSAAMWATVIAYFVWMGRGRAA